MIGKTYTESQCKALLNKDLNTVAGQINPYIKVDIPETTRGALYSFVYNVGAGNFKTSTLLHKINQVTLKARANNYAVGRMLAESSGKGLSPDERLSAKSVCGSDK